MGDIIDPQLMKSTDDAFWAHLNRESLDAREEKSETRYVVMDKTTGQTKVVITDARLIGEQKIEV